MEKQTKKIRAHGEKFIVVKQLKNYDKETGSDWGDGFEKIGNHYTLKGLASFLEDIGRNGNKINILCDGEIPQILKKYYIEQDEKRWGYLNNKSRESK